MRIDISRYFIVRTAPVVYQCTCAARALRLKKRAERLAKKPPEAVASVNLIGLGNNLQTRPVNQRALLQASPDQVTEGEFRPVRRLTADGSNGGNKVRFDSFEKKYSPRRLLLVLAFSVLTCGLLIKYLFIWFPKLPLMDMPLIGSAVLIVFLSPVLYAFFYTPMVRQYERLKAAEAMMRELALIDELTDLFNRRGFLSHAEHLLKLSNRTKKGLILIYADLDNMKQVNDEFGHEEGDLALVTISDVLKKTFRDSDVIGRVGGDEFAILAFEAYAESLDGLRHRLNGNLKRSKYNVNSRHKLTLSLGIIYYNPEKPQTIEELLRRADALMYKEKNIAASGV